MQQSSRCGLIHSPRLSFPFAEMFVSVYEYVTPILTQKREDLRRFGKQRTMQSNRKFNFNVALLESLRF